MAKKSVVKNYIYNLLYELFVIIVPIFVTPYVARVLGEDGSGQYSYTYSIVSYFILFAALGFTRYAQRLVAKHQGNRRQQSVDFWEIFIARLIPSAITLIVYYVIVFSNAFDSKYQTLLIIHSISVYAVIFDISFFFQGNEEFGKLVTRSIIIKAISIACIFIFVKTVDNLWEYALIQNLLYICSFLALWPYLPRYLEKVNFSELKPLKHLPATALLFLPTIATSVYTSLDKTLIGVITKVDAENGNYEYAEKLIKVSMTIVTSLGAVLVPRNSKLYESGDIEAFKNNIYKACKFVAFLGIPIMFGCIAIADNLIPWFLGDGYTKAATLMKILAPIIVIIGYSNIFGLQYLIPSGQDRRFTIAIVCGATINFTLNIVMINWWQSYGAAIATVIAECIVTIVMCFFIRKDIGFKRVFSDPWKNLLAGVIMFVPCYVLGHIFEPKLWNTLLIISIGGLIYAMLMIVFKDEFIFEGVSLIKKKFVKNKMEQ